MINVLALFDGHSGGQISIEVAGIPCAKYIASEIDKHASKVTKAIYPNTMQMGDVTKWREWDIDWASIDLLLGGSPCQGFSMAGKQAGTAAVLNGETIIVDTREKYLSLKGQGAEFLSQSHLFWEYILCLDHVKECNPDVLFLLENVKMKKEFLSLITEAIGVEPVFINSALVGAQNRQRYYWCNWEVTQPEDRGIMLTDILESEPDNATFMSDRFKARNAHILRDDLRGKAKSLSAMEYAKNGRQGDYINPAAIVGRKLDENGQRNDSLQVKQTQCLEVHEHGKSRCLSTVQKDTVVSNLPAGRYPLDAELPPYNEWIKKTGEHGGSKREYQSLIIQQERGGETSASVDRYPVGNHYRKLTPRECGRLQTIPESILENILNSGVSNTQLYKMFGNGWTIEVIVHILKQAPIAKKSQSAKKYKVIYADPPWSFNSKKTGGSMKSGASQQYDVMSLADMKLMDVAALCDDNCLLVMWYVGAMPDEALELARAWGFRVTNINGFVWDKETKHGKDFFGMGHITRASTESALVAVKGKTGTLIKDRSIRSRIRAKVGTHSAKPNEFREAIEKLCGDVPRLELFARTQTPGWDVFGNQADGSIEITQGEAA